MIRPIKCLICKVASGKQMSLIPVGLYCNAVIEKAAPGSIIDFEEGWRKTRVIMTRKCKVAVNSSVFTFLLKSIYGDGMTWERISEDFTALCVNEGLGGQAFSDKEMLLVEYRPFVKEEYEAEQERMRQERERQRKIAEREETLKAIREHRYKHPMVTDITEENTNEIR